MTAAQRYGEIAGGIKHAAQKDIERAKVGRLVLDLQERCAEQLVDCSITMLAGGRVHVMLHGTDWQLSIRTKSESIADAIDQALDKLNRGER